MIEEIGTQNDQGFYAENNFLLSIKKIIEGTW
jgi:hypothetical protein